MDITKKMILIALVFSVLIMVLTVVLIFKGQRSVQVIPPPVVAAKPVVVVAPPPPPAAPKWLEPRSGMYAIPVAIKSFSSVGNYLVPGSVVNVILSYPGNEGKKTTSKTLIKDAYVLAVNGATDNVSSSGSSVVLEVTSQEAEALSSAASVGSLSLVSGSPSDAAAKRANPHQNGFLKPDIKELLVTVRESFPNVPIHMSYEGDSLTVKASVTDDDQAKQIRDTLNQLLPPYIDVIDMIKIKPQQVLLRVKVLEMSKTVQDDLGLDWSLLFDNSGNLQSGIVNGTSFSSFNSSQSSNLSTGGPFIQAFLKSGSVNLQGLLNALRADNLITILAEPTLVTSSGKTASFLSGGEFPVLQAQGFGVTTADFNSYGVSLEFTPMVEADNTIRLDVSPEVSSVDFSGLVVSNGNKMPVKSTRKAKTTVRLKSGESYAIAGLLQNSTKNSNKDTKLLASVPLIGNLFKSNSTQVDGTDLIIIVTPVLMDKQSSVAHNDAALHKASQLINVTNSEINRINAKRINNKSMVIIPAEKQAADIKAAHGLVTTQAPYVKAKSSAQLTR
jgi:Flp pilus assembly secretin CpaC